MKIKEAAITILRQARHRQDAGLDGFGRVRPGREDDGEVGGGRGESRGRSAEKRAELVLRFAASVGAVVGCVRGAAVF